MEEMGGWRWKKWEVGYGGNWRQEDGRNGVGDGRKGMLENGRNKGWRLKKWWLAAGRNRGMEKGRNRWVDARNRWIDMKEMGGWKLEVVRNG